MANRDDDQFESYLKSFQPVAPEPLRLEKHPIRTGRLFVLSATAALSLLALVVVLALLSRTWQRLPPATPSANQKVATRPRENTNRSQMSTPMLAKLALDDHEAFDELMAEKVRTQFPPMKDEQSALRVLAKE